MAKAPEIKLVNHGVANHFGDYIEINKELLAYPDLYDYVLKHETSHTQKDFSLEDLKNEFDFDYKMVWKLFKFVMARPKLWYEFLPLYRREKVWHIDYILATLYIISFSLIVIFVIVFSLIL